MIGLFRQPRPLRRRVFMMLAALAVALQVLIPPGLMAATEHAGTAAFPLVICTGQTDDLADTAPDAPRKAADAPCLFAGHGTGGAPPSPPSLADASAPDATTPTTVAPQGLEPLARLMGPPLPARGPPRALI